MWELWSLGKSIITISIILGILILLHSRKSAPDAESLAQGRREVLNETEQDLQEPSGDSDTEGPVPATTPRSPGHRADLIRYKGVKLLDAQGDERAFNEVTPFENDYFKGKLLFMIKTDPMDPRVNEHFNGRQRLFELQIQGSFKKLPEGVLYMGAELTEKMHMGLVTKTVAGMILTFARRLIKNLHYSFGESGCTEEVELPHVTFPLVRGMDRLVVTPPGEVPPPLGVEFPETEGSKAGRKTCKGDRDFDLESTYSMSFHSMYLHFIDWRLVNIAGQRCIDFGGLLGESSIHIVVYDLPPTVAPSRHRNCDKRYFYRCELVKSAYEQEEEDDQATPPETEKQTDTAEVEREVDADPEVEDGELLKVFVRSGDVVELSAKAEDAGTWAGLAERKGYCVMRPGAVSMEVRVSKVRGSTGPYQSDFFCNGDIVTLRSMYGKYLSVYKGWWLHWTSQPPSSAVSRAHFVIEGINEAERLMIGRSFTLRSRKWAYFAVGAGDVSSAYGGRLLGLYQTSGKRKTLSRKSKTWLDTVLFRMQCKQSEAPEGAELEAASRDNSPRRSEDAGVQVADLNAFVDTSRLGLTVEEVEESLEVEVAIWIEMWHRRRRRKQRAYALRVSIASRPDVSWTAIRAGTQLVEILRMQKERQTNCSSTDVTSPSPYILSDRRPTTSMRRSLTTARSLSGPLQHQLDEDQSVFLLNKKLESLLTQGPDDSTSQSVSGRSALYSLLKRRTYLDVWFASGSAADIGVAIPPRPFPVMQTMVVRALWETHWKECWAVLYPTHISFFSHGARRPSLSLLLHEIRGVRTPATASLRNLFPGRHFLCIELLGRVHYLCFAGESSRDSWLNAIQMRCGQQPCDDPAGAVISDPREAFVIRGGQWKPSDRLVLNARRMSFDTQPLAGSPSQVSEEALRLAYSLCADSSPEQLIHFYDHTSAFRAVDLNQLDLSSDEALAFFLNLYHTILQHAFVVLSAPGSKKWNSFFSFVSYQIGADVFSLTEIEYCVLRGKLTRPRYISRHMAPPPPSTDDHYRYALSNVDYRINFALVNLSLSSPPFVTIYRSNNVSDQLDNAATRHVDYSLRIDVKRRTISLPKVCDLYRKDFCGTEVGVDMLNVVLKYLTDRVRCESVVELLAGTKVPLVKYRSLKTKCHESLCLSEDRNNALDKDL